jgi:hypothetical protein
MKDTFMMLEKQKFRGKKIHFNMNINILTNRQVRKALKDVCKEYGLGLTPDAENFRLLKNIYT